MPLYRGSRRLILRGGSDAPQTTAFLGRTSGLSATERNAYRALINGLVSDGVFSLLDALYIFATNTTTTANLNLANTNFTLTGGVPLAFTADQGYTGNGTTQFLDTGFNPSTAGGATTLNNASLGVYTRTNRAANSSVQAGVADATAFSYVSVFQGTGLSVEMNGFTFPAPVTADSLSQGFSAVSRTSSANLQLYKNASSSSLFTITDASTNLPNRSIYIGGYNNAGTLTSPTSDQISAVFFGAGITGAQFLLISNRMNAYMTALGVNVY